MSSNQQEFPETDERLSRKIRQRRCIATHQVVALKQLVRFVTAPDGMLTLDLKGKLPGRGAHLTPTREALDQAIKSKAFGRAFKCSVAVPENFAETISNLVNKNLLTRLSLARRSGDLIVGQDAVFAAANRGKIALLILPVDTTENSAARLAGIARDFPTLTFCNAEMLGETLGKPRISNIAFTHSIKAEQFWDFAYKFRDFLAIKFHEPES